MSGVDSVRSLQPVLNEVLSLNAQELSKFCAMGLRCTFLNEVLSLNAQELEALVTAAIMIVPPQ